MWQSLVFSKRPKPSKRHLLEVFKQNWCCALVHQALFAIYLVAIYKPSKTATW
jgi:hypothetical protein